MQALEADPAHVDGGGDDSLARQVGCSLQPQIHPAMGERFEVLSGHPSIGPPETHP
jgi:hypothetical protein